jgi:hypothetical protein
MLKNAFFAWKSEARSTKSETISNDQNANFQNKNPLVQRFWYSIVSVISILNLSFDVAQDGEPVEPFRVSTFGFRISDFLVEA